MRNVAKTTSDIEQPTPSPFAQRGERADHSFYAGADLRIILPELVAQDVATSNTVLVIKKERGTVGTFEELKWLRKI